MYGRLRTRNISHLRLFLFLAANPDVFFMSETSDPRIVADDLGVGVPMLNRLARWENDLGLFFIALEMGYDFCWMCRSRRRQEVDSSGGDLKEPFSFYQWRMRNLVGLVDKPVQ